MMAHRKSSKRGKKGRRRWFKQKRKNKKRGMKH